MPEDLTPSAAAPFLPFALPDIDEAEIEAVVACLRSGWVTTGPATRQFEQDFNAYLGGGLHAISVNSATAGLHLALESLGICLRIEAWKRNMGAQPVHKESCQCEPQALLKILSFGEGRKIEV